MLQHAKALPPFYRPNSKILILGSFPSVKSRQTEFFYAHGQNRMWPMLAQYFNMSADNVQQRQLLLQNASIAMWDIVAECDIEGSKDSSITNVVIAHISTITSVCPICAVLCNGKLSYDLTVKHFGTKLTVPIERMPSTSSQNVSFDKNVWHNALHKYLD